MRILLVTHELALNGACVGLVRLAGHMVKRGHEVDVMTPPDRVRAFASELVELGARMVTEIYPAQYDVAVINTLYGHATLNRLAGAVPLVWWIKEGPHGFGVAVTNESVRKAFSNADRIAFNAPFLASDVYRSFVCRLPSERSTVVGNGIPPRPEVRPAPRDPARPRILCVASIYPRKRQTDLVEAVARLKDRGVECIMVGERHSTTQAALDTINANPQLFRMPGALPWKAVHSLYASADVACLPSGDESISRAPLEAGQHGLASVLTDLPAYKGLWSHGRNTLLYPVGDITMLSWSLRLLLDEPAFRRKLGEAARATAAAYSDTRMLANMEMTIEDAYRAGRLRR